MLNTLKNIKFNLEDRVYKNERQIRYSLVTKILHELEWDIWNPSEVFYDYPVRNCHDTNNKHRCSVDIALFINHLKNPIAYIQTTEIGALIKNLADYEKQMSDLNRYETAEISILTDGIIWKIYFSQDSGHFASNIAADFNLLKDDMNYIVSIFNEVINKKKRCNEAKQAILRDQSIIDDINQVRAEAEDIAPSMMLSPQEAARRYLITQHNKEYSLETINEYWDKKIDTSESLKNEYQNDRIEQKQTNSVNEISMHDLDIGEELDLYKFTPTYKSIRRAHIFGEWKKIKVWTDIFVIICTELLKRFPDTDLNGFLSDQRPKNNMRFQKMSNGQYLYTNHSAKYCILHSLDLLKKYNLEGNLKIYSNHVCERPRQLT